MPTDIFCKLYPVWNSQGKIIFQNDHAFSILSVTPVVPGQPIIISKTHVERLEQLQGSALEGFIAGFSSTIKAVQGIYESDPEKIIQFYESLKQNPPTPTSAAMAQRMLEHRHLRVRPSDDYNVGINVGYFSGASEGDHLHAQLFPTREHGPGVVKAMQSVRP